MSAALCPRTVWLTDDAEGPDRFAACDLELDHPGAHLDTGKGLEWHDGQEAALRARVTAQAEPEVAGTPMMLDEWVGQQVTVETGPTMVAGVLAVVYYVDDPPDPRLLVVRLGGQGGGECLIRWESVSRIFTVPGHVRDE